jgi:acyl-CoA ligase (AMP-forming) (exosortase A-associated)
MATLVHELISDTAQHSPKTIAVQIKDSQLSYAQLNDKVNQVAQCYLSLAIARGDRIGIYLAKNQENIQSMFACSKIGAVFVPINPVLKASQVEHIANDCQIQLLITNQARLKALSPILDTLQELKTIIIIDANNQEVINLSKNKPFKLLNWSTFTALNKPNINVDNHSINSLIKTDELAAILYTSGSTGRPKGIMLSHKNIVLGANSVSEYLQLSSSDNILVVLPLSFDYGLNQLTSSFLVGATCVLLDYLLANDVIKAITKYNITGLAAVPPLWMQLTKVSWPDNIATTMRYFTNSGGVLPHITLASLREKMPQAKPYLMYGLTEAFRSSYLEPSKVDIKPNSIGKAIPNAELLVLREDGTECHSGEVGELVHAGPLVTLGYWQNSSATRERYKEVPEQVNTSYKKSLAVFSGDYVKKDDEGDLYFVSRKDAMIKTSGYRVSPNELESELVSLAEIDEVLIIARPSQELGQEIVALIVTSMADQEAVSKVIKKHCQMSLPNYMIPKQLIFLTELTKNANGKVDTTRLTNKYS